MPIKIEGNHISDVVKFEQDSNYSREEATLASGAGNLKIGTVLGKITTDIIGTVTPDGGNTGNGIAGTATAGLKTEVGIYTLTCVATATNAGTFEIATPEGKQLAADLTVAAAYVSEHINLTIADGSTDFSVGDIFTVAISGSGKYVAANPTLVNGAAKAAAVLINDDDATAADVDTLILKRQAVINRNNLIWDASINTAGERQTAVDELEAIGIVAREGA